MPPLKPAASVVMQLAPSGALRAATLTGSAYITSDDGSIVRGPAVDVAHALGAAAGRPVSIIRYASIGALLADATTGKWDVAFMGHDASRETVVDWAGIYMHSANTFLVPRDSKFIRVSDIDKPGVRVGTINRSFQESTVRETFKSAELRSHPDNVALVDALAAGRVEAIAGPRSNFTVLAARNPSFRVLEEDVRPSRLAVALPKGRPQARDFVAGFLEQARRNGVVARAIAEAKVPGLSVPE